VPGIAQVTAGWETTYFSRYWAYFLDAIVAWGLTGLWLGWWLRRGRTQMSSVRIPEREKELA
jgi:hypothetical protein